MLSWMFVIVLLCEALAAELPKPKITTCEEFEHEAHFDPYEIIDSMWKIFYFWADNTQLYPIVFSLPAQNRLLKFKHMLEVIDPQLDLEWNKSTLFMNPKPGTEVLFLYQGMPGAFRAVVKVEQRNNKVRPYPTPLIKMADVRVKVVGMYMGMMCCEDLTAYAMARMDDVPATEAECIAAASTLNYTGIDGRSYIYLKKRLEDEL